MKRIISLVLSVLMISLCFVSGTSAFTDVTEYEDEINTLYGLGIISGIDTEGNIYDPDSPVLRWHMALLIAKAVTGKVEDAYKDWYSETNTTPFTDVNKDQFFGSIIYAYENGIIIGRTTDIFDPEGEISYQDVLTMLVRAVGEGSEEMDKGYPDSFISKAEELGITEGFRSDAEYGDRITRAEAAKLLYNAFLLNEPELPDDDNSENDTEDTEDAEDVTEPSLEGDDSIVYVSNYGNYYVYENYDTLGGHNQNYYEIYVYNAIDVLTGELRTVKFEGGPGRVAESGFYYVNEHGELSQDPISGELRSANREITSGTGETRFSRYEVEIPGVGSVYGWGSRAWIVREDGKIDEYTEYLYSIMEPINGGVPMASISGEYAVQMTGHYNHKTAVIIYFE